MNTGAQEWVGAGQAWCAFCAEHPELNYPAGMNSYYNFLRRYRTALRAVDAIRFAKGRFWIAHVRRFNEAAFECATGNAHALAGGVE